MYSGCRVQRADIACLRRLGLVGRSVAPTGFMELVGFAGVTRRFTSLFL